MGMLDKFKKNRYKSNVKLSQLGLIDQLDRMVAVIINGEELSIDRAMHICITPDSLRKAQSEIDNDYKIKCDFIEIPLGIGIDNIVQNDICDVLVIHGLTPMELIVSRDKLLELKDIIDSFCIMYAAVRNKMDIKKAYELMKQKTVYILGNMILPDMKKEDTFGFETIKRKDDNGQEYESVKCFLNEESASKYNMNKRDITPVNLQKIKDFFGTVIVEPHRNYWIEFR